MINNTNLTLRIKKRNPYSDGPDDNAQNQANVQDLEIPSSFSGKALKIDSYFMRLNFKF